MDRINKIMEGAAYWGAFFRENVDKFAEMYLHLRLRLFQRIVLVMMFWSTTFVWIAARGASKTFMSAVYSVIRCILYPGTKVVIACKVRSQGINVLEKITQELVPNSPELKNEIDWRNTQINGSKAIIAFKNTSTIQVATASDSARGKRASVLLLDEYRLINKNTVDDILKKFLNWRRSPRYSELTPEERNAEYDKEKNLTLYLSSAWWKDSWAYTKCTDTLKAMVNPKRKQFICAFPYELSIAEGLLDPDAVADEMLDTQFSEIRWSIKFLCSLNLLNPDACWGCHTDYDANRETLSAILHMTILCQDANFA